MHDFECAKAILDIIPPTMHEIRSELREIAKSEITVPQFRILARLSRSLDTNRELAEWMGVSPPTISRMLDPLVRRALVERDIGKADRREVRLSLTTEGRALYQKIRKEVQFKLADHISKLSTQDKNSLAEGLRVLSEIFL